MHNDTKAMDFNRKAKIAISERDSINGWPCCVYCGSAAPAPLVWSNAHYISRGQGGLGIPENGLTLCPACHSRYDQSDERERMRDFFRDYLGHCYQGWREEKLIYRKGESS